MSAFAAVLKKTEKVAEPKKTTSKVKELTASKDVKDAIDQYVSLKKQSKEVASEMAFHADTISDFVGGIQDKEGFAGDYTNSYRVAGHDQDVTVVNPNRFSVSTKDEKEIQKLVGKKNFGSCFEETHTVAFNGKVMADEKLQSELVDFVGGPEKFAEFVEKFMLTSKTLKVKKGFNERVYSVVKPEKLVDLRVFVKPAKLAIK
jgi:hypothetical protein